MSELSLPGLYVNSPCSPSDNSDAVYLRVGAINESGPKTMCQSFLCQVYRNFGKLPFLSHLGKYIIKIGKISTKIHEIGKIKAIFWILNDCHMRL